MTEKNDNLIMLIFKSDSVQFNKEFETRLGALKKDVELQKGPIDDQKKAQQKAELDILSDALRKGSKLFSSSFWLQKYQNELDEIQQKLSRSQKTQFSFKERFKMKPASETKQAQPKPEATLSPTSEEQEITDWIIHDLKDQRIEHVSDGNKVSINNLENCTVYIPNKTPILSVWNSQNCTFIIPTVEMSAHINKCDSCQFAFSILQLRIHQTTNTDFYISCQNEPIIEKCTNVRFAPLKGEESGSWNKVKDFDHPETNTSPNWAVIPETERKIPEW